MSNQANIPGTFWHFPEHHFYAVYVELVEEAEGGYSVTVPALAGAVSQGETYSEAIANITEALTAVIEQYVADGDEIPWQAAVPVVVAAPDGTRWAWVDVPDGQWTEEKNQRRCDLIEKDFAGTITPAERVEEADLRQQMQSHLRKVAPLPIAEMTALHDGLKRRAPKQPHQSKTVWLGVAMIAAMMGQMIAGYAESRGFPDAAELILGFFGGLVIVVRRFTSRPFRFTQKGQRDGDNGQE